MVSYYNINQIVLTKGQEQYIFRYEPGCENQFMDAIIDAAKDKRTSFDWFDAAVISSKLIPYLIGQAGQLLNGDKIDPTQQFNIEDLL